MREEKVLVDSCDSDFQSQPMKGMREKKMYCFTLILGSWDITKIWLNEATRGVEKK